MRPQRILLVEDDRSFQDMLTLFLNTVYEVRQATTAAQALEILRRDSISAIVLDYRLPDRTGLELLTEIKSSQPCLPVVMVTGYGSEWLCASALKGGISDYFAKPFSPSDLLDSIRRLLSGRPTADAPRRQLVTESARTTISMGASATFGDASIENAVRLIQESYADGIGLSDLAQAVGMSKYSLSRRFKQVMGITFRAYLLQLRLEKAKDLLPSRQFSITQVAQMVGFGDLPRFDKVFKRYAGVTPSAYRTTPAGSKEGQRRGKKATSQGSIGGR